MNSELTPAMIDEANRLGASIAKKVTFWAPEAIAGNLAEYLRTAMSRALHLAPTPSVSIPETPYRPCNVHGGYDPQSKQCPECVRLGFVDRPSVGIDMGIGPDETVYTTMRDEKIVNVEVCSSEAKHWPYCGCSDNAACPHPMQLTEEEKEELRELREYRTNEVTSEAKPTNVAPCPECGTTDPAIERTSAGWNRCFDAYGCAKRKDAQRSNEAKAYDPQVEAHLLAHQDKMPPIIRDRRELFAWVSQLIHLVRESEAKRVAVEAQRTDKATVNDEVRALLVMFQDYILSANTIGADPDLPVQMRRASILARISNILHPRPETAKAEGEKR